MSREQETSGSVPLAATRVGKGKAFGTFGELLQGHLPEHDSDFLVTLPIAHYSSATFLSDAGSTTVTTLPPQKQKSQLLARFLLDYYQLPQGGKLVISSDLPVGKGLASSSADLVATARAIAGCFEIIIPLDILQRLMARIEPTDGVMYPGVVAFYHRRVQLRTFLGALPALTVVSIDEGGELDTIAFNHRPRSFPHAEKHEYHALLERLAIAVQQRDVRVIGQIATRSAQLNQRRNPKRTLKDLIAICRDVDGLGVVVAHSGTCLGLLLSPHEPRYPEQLRAARQHLASLSETITIYRTVCFS